MLFFHHEKTFPEIDTVYVSSMENYDKIGEDKKFTENLELESFLFSKLWYNKTSSFTKGEDEDYEKS